MLAEFEEHGYSEVLGSPGPLMVMIDRLRDVSLQAAQIREFQHAQSDGFATAEHSAWCCFPELFMATVVASNSIDSDDHVRSIVEAVRAGVAASG